MIENIKEKSLKRIKIIKGQAGGLEKMIENDKYCIDIINQSFAMQKSLASLNKLILENHIRTHLSHQLASKDTEIKENAVQEMLNLYAVNIVKGAGK
jgi:DNA-binding FrmR family transcriptional regulator